MPAVFQIAPIGGSSLFFRPTLRDGEKLLQKAGKWIVIALKIRCNKKGLSLLKISPFFM